MTEWLTPLWDTTGFNPRKSCGTGWTPEWVAVHTLSDVLIWLAYLSIPLVLLAVARHRAIRNLQGKMVRSQFVALRQTIQHDLAVGHGRLPLFERDLITARATPPAGLSRRLPGRRRTG